MNAHHASGLLLLLSAAALGCDGGDDGTDAGTATTSGTTGAPMTAGDASGTTTTGPAMTTEPASSSGSSSSDGSGSSTGTDGTSSSGTGDDTGTTGVTGSPLCIEHGNVVEKCTDSTFEYGLGYCEYAVEAGAEYSADCGDAWEAFFGCINGVDCKDFGVEGVPGCEAEEEKLNSVCP